MTDPAETLLEPRVYVHIEREMGDRYSILSTDLGTIGSQLRGKSRFSIFNSIILPVIVTFVTFMLTSFFQYISWQNSIKLQGVTEEATAASKTYDKAASEIDKRYYATYLFAAVVKNLASRKTAVEPQKAAAESQKATTETPKAIAEQADPLNQYDIDLQKHRFEDFYKQLVSWNNNYSQLLSDISYDIDRPIKKQQWTEDAYLIKKDFLDKVICDVTTLSEQITTNNRDPSALANQFAVVNKCFGKATASIATLKERVLSNKEGAISEDEYGKANEQLDSVRTILNHFRCYALSRIHFLSARKERTVVFANWFDGEQPLIDAHFLDTEKKCDPKKGE